MFSICIHHSLHRICFITLMLTSIMVGMRTSHAQDPLPSADACNNPNPRRAVISQDLVEFHSDLVDGSFEQGTADVVLLDAHDTSLSRADVVRTEVAARTGAMGYAISANAQQGIAFTIRGYVDKGEDTRFLIWARSPNGPTQARPVVFWVERPDQQLSAPEIFPPVMVGMEWTAISIQTATTHGIRYALFGLEVGPNTTLHLDDAAIEFPIWRLAEYAAGASRTVGGMAVPAQPAAPVHIAFLIHIEDPALITQQASFFYQKTAVFRALAELFFRHGGFLTIQPEEDWVLAAEAGFAPGLLAELAVDYGVVYSTHTHGPICRDDRGRLRSSSDCNAHREWNRTLADDDVLEYVDNLRELISAASGQTVTDHNGNFTFQAASRFAEVPMHTWSAYKNSNTQRTYDWLIINPWRPGEGNANANIENFVTHDPGTNIVYIPGWSQSLTRHPQRALLKARHMLSQVIYYADPNRVNTFYFVLHVDHFYSRTDNPTYITYDDQTGQIRFGSEFEQHLHAWEVVLTEVVDPLVAAGYLQWASLPEMGEMYREWETTCGRE